MKIVWNNKVGLIPPAGARENQCRDVDLNEIKAAVNTNDDESIKASGGVATICEINGALIEKTGGSDKTTVELNDKCIYKRFSGNEILIGHTYTNEGGAGDGNPETISNWEYLDTVTT